MDKFAQQERIKKIIEEYGITLYELAAKMGVAQQTLYDAANGRTFLGTGKIFKLKEVLPDLNMEWYFTGLGSIKLLRILAEEKNEEAANKEEKIANRAQELNTLPQEARLAEIKELIKDNLAIRGEYENLKSHTEELQNLIRQLAKIVKGASGA